MIIQLSKWTVRWFDVDPRNGSKEAGEFRKSETEFRKQVRSKTEFWNDDVVVLVQQENGVLERWVGKTNQPFALSPVAGIDSVEA